MNQAPKKTVSRESDKFMLRFPDGMRDLVAQTAERHGRSMNSEIIHALHDYYMRQGLHEQHVDGRGAEEIDVIGTSNSAPQSLQIDNLADVIVARLAERLGVQKVEITPSGKMVATLDSKPALKGPRKSPPKR